jgi:alpha-ketoglutarate-dependent taurine dioxygenase
MQTLQQTYDFLVKKARSLDYEVLQTEFEIKAFLELIKQNGDFTVAACREGEYSEVIQTENMTDHSKQSGDFTLHKDGAYLETFPRYVLLYCEHGGSGLASTYIADSTNVIESLSASEIQILSGLDYIYLNKDGSEQRHALLQRDPLSGKMITNYSGRGYIRPTQSPTQFLPTEMADYIPVVNTFISKLSQAEVFRHTLKKHDLFIFDNYRYLHGRSSMGIDGARHLYRIWLNPVA